MNIIFSTSRLNKFIILISDRQTYVQLFTEYTWGSFQYMISTTFKMALHKPKHVHSGLQSTSLVYWLFIQLCDSNKCSKFNITKHNVLHAEEKYNL
jgi:hypothetical protein